MIKYFCDICGDEITEKNKAGEPGGQNILLTEIYTGEGPRFIVEVQNDGEFCKYCIIDAVKSLDDRNDPFHHHHSEPLAAQIGGALKGKAWTPLD